MFAFARFLSGVLFLLLGLNQIFHFKLVHEKLLCHLQILQEATKGFFHGMYHLLYEMASLLIVIAFLCQIILGISFLFSYRVKMFGKIALILWFLYLAIYYPFYLFEEDKAFLMILDFTFACFQFVVILFCLKQKKSPVERQVDSTYN